MKIGRLGSGPRRHAPRMQGFVASVAASSLAAAAGLLGAAGFQPAQAAPPEASEVAGSIGFELPPSLVDIQPADGALDASIEGVLTLTFSEPIEPDDLGYLNVDLQEQGGYSVVGRLSVDGAVVTFAPIRPLALDHDYIVQVAAIVHDSGWNEVAETAFRTRDGVWSAPRAVVEADASSPELTVDADGNAVLLWQANTAQGARLRGAHFDPANGTWELLSFTASGGPAARPVFVAAGGAGLFALVWAGTGLQGGLYQLGDDDFLDGYSRLGPARVLSTATGALFSGGRALVATNYAGALLDVHHTEGDAFWPGAKSIAAADDGSRFAGPLLIADGTSAARALWMRTAGPDGASVPVTVSGVTLFYSGDWSEPEVLATLGPSDGVEALTGVGSDGGLSLMAWEDGGASANAASASGPRLGLLTLAGDGSASVSRPEGVDTLGAAYRPAVAASAAGDALVTWVASSSSARDGQTTAWGAFQPAGSTWSAPVQLSAAGDVQAGAPRLALDATGNGHAVWIEVDGAGSARLATSRCSGETGFGSATYLTSGGTAEAPATASGLAADLGNGPRLAVDPQGRALAVWVSAAGGVWYSRFE